MCNSLITVKFINMRVNPKPTVGGVLTICATSLKNATAACLHAYSDYNTPTHLTYNNKGL